jgi:hypothetical protein
MACHAREDTIAIGKATHLTRPKFVHHAHSAALLQPPQECLGSDRRITTDAASNRSRPVRNQHWRITLFSRNDLGQVIQGALLLVERVLPLLLVPPAAIEGQHLHPLPPKCVQAPRARKLHARVNIQPSSIAANCT